MSVPAFRTDRPRLAVLTAVSGQHGHLLNHVDGLALSTWPPDVHVAVSLGDRELTRGRVPITSDRWTTTVPRLPHRKGRSTFLPALELAAREALRQGADVLIHLGVDCIPGPRLLELLAEDAVEASHLGPSVSYVAVIPLAPAVAQGRYPVATDLGALAASGPSADHRRPLAMALDAAFAATPATWATIAPCIRALGADGGSPQDLVDIIDECSIDLHEVPGATAYQQHPSGASLSFRGSPRVLALRGDPCHARAAG